MTLPLLLLLIVLVFAPLDRLVEGAPAADPHRPDAGSPSQGD